MFLLAFLLLGRQPHDASAANQRTLYIFGDSWSEQMSDGQLQQELVDRSFDSFVTINSHAIGGSTLDQWVFDEANVLTNLVNDIENDPNANPIVFFTLGGNDILIDWAEPADLAEPFEDVLFNLQETRPDVQIVVGNYDILNPAVDSAECNALLLDRFDTTQPADINPYLLSIDSIYQTVAAQFNRAQVVNTYGSLQGQPGNPNLNQWSPVQYLSDCIHLTDGGYSIYLDTVFDEALTPLICADASVTSPSCNGNTATPTPVTPTTVAPQPTATSHHPMPTTEPPAGSYVVANSGNWTESSTWQGGQLPPASADILIPMGKTLTVNSQITTKFESVQIEGTLRFATNANTELWVDTIRSGHHGTLEIGTSANPIAPNVTARVVFADLGAIDRAVDPQQLSRGAILHGPTTMYGAAKTHRITVATFPTAGATTLQLSSAPTGWRIGDELVITGSRGNTSEEVRTITALNGATVTLNQPLALDHVPPKPDLNLWVANITRNIQIESENTADIRRRGHIMFMHNSNVDLNYAGFYGLGRTDKRIELDDWEYEILEVPGNENPAPIHFTPIAGPANNIRGRYALHVHRAGTAPGSNPAIFKGSVVVDSPGWGFVNHSSNVDMIDNVSYNVQGAGFYTEAGDEVGSMVGNIAIRTVNDAFVLDDLGAIDPDLGLHLGDFGNDGDGFWLSGNRVSVIDNVAAGASAHGIIFWTDGLIEPDTGRATVNVNEIANGHLITNRDTIPVWWAPLAEVRDNESYGTTVGFRSRYIHSTLYLGEEISSAFHQAPPQAYLDTLNPVFDGVTVWDSRDGILLNYNERVSLRNVRVIGIGAPFQHNLGQTAAIGVGVDFNNEVTNGPGFIENVTIEGYEMGLLAPRHGNWRLSNLTLKNVTDIMFHEGRVEPRIMPMTNIEFGSLDGTAVAGRESERRNIVLDPHFDDSSHDPNFLVFPDTITLDGYEIFFDQQQPNFIPYGPDFDYDPIPGMPPFNNGYRNKTNQQLWNQYGVAFGGEVLPTDAVNDVRIVNGKLASTPSSTPTSVTYLPAVNTSQPDAGIAFSIAGLASATIAWLFWKRAALPG